LGAAPFGFKGAVFEGKKEFAEKIGAGWAEEREQFVMQTERDGAEFLCG